jgi:hypothetical protein
VMHARKQSFFEKKDQKTLATIYLTKRTPHFVPQPTLATKCS